MIVNATLFVAGSDLSFYSDLCRELLQKEA